MAEISFDRNQEQGNTYRVVWDNLKNGDTGQPVSFPGAADYTIQVFGAFGTGGTVVMEGTCEKVAAGATFFALKDPQGNAMTYTTADGEMVSQVVMHLRPRISAGDGSTDLTVIAFFRSTMR